MSSILTISNRFRAEVLRGDKEMLRRLSSAYSLINRSLMAEWKVLQRDIEQAQREGKTVNKDWLRRSLRYQSLIRQTKQQIQAYSNGARLFIESRQRSAIDLGQDHAAELIQRGAEITFARLPTEAINELVGVLEDGSPLSKVLDRLAGEAAGEIRSSLIAGLGSGHGAGKVAREIRHAIDVPRWKALQIARTETMRAYRQSTLQTYAENSDVLDGWIWTSTLSTRTCAACWSLHGTFFPLSKQFFPAHVSCFPAGVLVTGPGVRATSTRWYEGELVDLQFASGKTLSVTPNHPILTAHGWIAAGLLNEGCDVVSSPNPEAAAALVDPNDYQIPSLIENVTQSRFSEPGMVSVSVPTAAEDFHGDGAGSDVSVIRTNRDLLNTISNPALFEQFDEPILDGRSMGTPLLSSFGPLDLFVKSLLTIGGSGMGGFAVLPILFGRPLCHHQAVGLSRPATFDASNAQTRLDNLAGNSERFGESVFRFTGEVSPDNFGVRNPGLAPLSGAPLFFSEGVSSSFIPEESARLDRAAKTLLANVETRSEILNAFSRSIQFDRVVKTSRRGWSGHVYNLETKTGWYIANGILTHNCRCTSIPSVKGSQPNITAGAIAFAKLPVDDQLAVLGPSRYEMYSSGTPLDDFVMLTRDKEWGGAYQVKPLWKMKQKKRAA